MNKSTQRKKKSQEKTPRPPRRRLSVFRFSLFALCFALASPALARPDYDPATGASLLHYPPHRLANLLHLGLDISIPDMNIPYANVRETLTLAPIAGPLHQLRLNAAHIAIKSITCQGHEVTWSDASKGDPPEADAIDINFDPPAPPHQAVELVMTYELSDPAEGLIWTTSRNALTADIYQTPQLHTQGEPESNRYWFITRDFPNDRFATDLSVDVPKGFLACSNGKLIDHHAVNATTDHFHFQLSSFPGQVSYLVSLVVGKFDVVEINPRGAIPMPVYVRPGDGPLVKHTFARTPAMVRLFELATGHAYPWPKYAQLCVGDFEYGGMENTSATTLRDDLPMDGTALKDGDADDLISHELFHQWFGDLITCRSWAHIWLNEGFATYGEALWAQYREAITSREVEPRSLADLRPDNDAYLEEIWHNLQAEIAGDLSTPEAGEFEPAMVSEAYRHPDEVFDRDANAYPKGALVLHMLRARLGDALFFRVFQSYVRTYQGQEVETYNFRRLVEDQTGLNFERFFDQWCNRAGVPRVRVEASWSSEDRMLELVLHQTQPIDANNPAFALRLPVWVHERGDEPGRWTKTAVRFDARRTNESLALKVEPDMVVVDPELSELTALTLVQPEAWTIAALERGPTLVTRLWAARTLGSTSANDAPLAVAALGRVVRDEKANLTLRMTCAKSLGRLANPKADEKEEEVSGSPSSDALVALTDLVSDRTITTPRVRAKVIDALATAASRETLGAKVLQKEVGERLAGLFADEPSQAVRAAIVRAMGVLKPPSARRIIDLALATDSHGDKIRGAAVEALTDLDTRGDLARVIGLAQDLPGASRVLRIAATRAIGELSHFGPDSAAQMLASLAVDRLHSVRIAAIDALGEVDCEKTGELLEGAAQRAPSGVMRLHAERALKTYRERAAKVKESAGK